MIIQRAGYKAFTLYLFNIKLKKFQEDPVEICDS